MEQFEGVTIDPPGARDLDDAFHVEPLGGGWRVRVAFPRLTDLVPAGGGLDLDARRRGATRYAGRRTPDWMLPADATERLSLTADAPKDVFVLRLDLDARLDVVASGVTRASFLSLARLSYPEAATAAASGPARVRSILGAGRDLSRALERRRVASGSLAFRDLGAGMATDEEGRAAPFAWGGHWAEAAVRELMILANASLAALCAERDVPILFRNHRARGAANRSSLVEDVGLVRSGLLSVDALAGRISLVAGRATLGPAVEGHWGLALPAYAWFTSPIRRYADLVNQRNLEAVLEGRRPPHDATALSSIGPALDALSLAEQGGRSESFKREAGLAAEAAIRRGGLHAVGKSAFAQVVKAATLSEDLDDGVLREARRRLAAGDLTVKEMARLLSSGSAEAARAVVEHLVADPSVAVSLADHAAKSALWSSVAYDERCSGPPHAPSFVVSATLSADGRTASSPPCTAGSLRTARQAACARAIAALHGIDVPPPDDVPPPAPVAAKVPAGPNGKGALLEFCQARRIPPPTYEVESSGPPHAPTFVAVARVVLDGRLRASTPATAATTRAAEAAAALDLLAALRSVPA